jgi:2-oxo-4-hydroxy-4-carboxy--5-ureidoimidazoline (OHCU) decarboxylase
MRELPRELTADQLAELFEGREPDPLTRARTLVHELPDDEKREILDAHPAIGQRTGLSARSAAEQGSDDDPAVLDELARLNAAYEERHGFRFVVFVNRRPRAEILEVLRERIDNPTGEERETALDELVAIAEDRWLRG